LDKACDIEEQDTCQKVFGVVELALYRIVKDEVRAKT
jgi:hypothetical protein